MSKKFNEQISALIDGEADHAEMQQIFDGLGKDRDACARWERYHLISDALKNNLPPHLGKGLAERVSEALRDEPTVLAPRWRSLFSLPREVKHVAAGMAVAASVTAVTILSVQTLNFASNPTPVVSTPSLASAAQPATDSSIAPVPIRPVIVPVTKGQPRAVEPKMASRLSTYLVNHNEYSASSGMQGALPYKRIVGRTPAERVAHDER